MTFSLSCPHCGGECQMQASGAPGPTYTTALVRCSGCRAEWLISVKAVLTKQPNPAGRTSGCGTITGYRRHFKAGETPCDACKEANREGKRQFRRKARMK